MLYEQRIDVEGGYQIVVRGSGGGKKKPSTSTAVATSTAQESPNNLRSRDDAIVLLLLGEGEIEGPISGDLLRDIYLDGTPIKNPDGSFNFQNVIVDYRSGTQWQSYIPGMASAVEKEESVGVQVKVSTGPTTRTITNPNANAVRVRLLVPSLLYQDDKGNVVGSEVELSIQISTQGSGFQEVHRDKIAGKTTGSYERSYRIPLSTTGPWDLRIQRITPDSANARTQNDLYWQSYVEIIDAKLAYPNSALLGVRVSAEQFQSIPKVSVGLKLLKILVPHNYDPINRSYSGIFNGSLVRRFSNNPAWCFYDLLTNTRYGSGRFISEDQVDIWSLYSIAQYCDEPVSNGKGGLEPRFTCNCYLQSQEDAAKILESLASCFRGMMYQSGNTVTLVQDKPSVPVRAYTKANVVVEYDEEGKMTSPPFNYSGTSLETRYTVANVSWTDPEDFYKSKIESVEDLPALARFGFNPTEVVAFGCTSRAQAHRIGKWMLLSQRELTQTITFRVGAEGLLVKPGEVFKVLDPLKSVSRLGGRIRAATTTGVRIDDAIAIESGKTYNLSIVKSDGKIESRIINNSPGTHEVLSVSAPFSETPRHIWILESNDLQAQLFRCVSVPEIDAHLYEIIGVEHNASIYDAVEKGLKLEDPPISGFPNPRIPPEPPPGLTIMESLYETIGSAGVRNKIDITWQHSPSPFIREYQVEYRKDIDTDSRVVTITSNLSAVLFDVTPGVYTFSIKAINNYGKNSIYSYAQKELLGLTSPPANVSNFTVTAIDKYALLKWNSSPDLDVRVGGYFKIKHTTKKKSFTWADGIELAQVGGNNTSVNVPLLNGSYLIKAVDSQGNQSMNATQVTIDNLPDLLAFNAMAVTTQHPNFPGIHTSTVVIDGKLRLTSKDYFDSIPGMFDDIPGMFDDVAGFFDSIDGLFDDIPGDFDGAGTLLGISSYGVYEFANPVDLGDVYTSRLTADISAYNVDEALLFDRIGGMFDDIKGLFDGGDDDNSKATLQIATSMDNQIYSPWRDFVTGDYKARSFKFRMVLESGGTNHNMYVDQLLVRIDAPDRTTAGNLITAPGGNISGTFDYPFAVPPEIAITVQNGETGDYPQVSNLTTSGFLINVRNAAGNFVVRNISYIAKGFGKKG